MSPRRASLLPLAFILVVAGCIPWPLPVGTPVRHLPPERGPVVAITFDDGPHPVWTPRVLDVLARHDATATFFLVGAEAERHPELVREIARRGHQVAGHTWDHRSLRGLGPGAFAATVDRANDLLGGLSGGPVRCVRPPMGATDGTVTARLRDRSLATALWSHDTNDWRRPGQAAITRAALADLRPGSVVLFHDGGGDRSQTVAALPAILEGIRARGLRTAWMC